MIECWASRHKVDQTLLYALLRNWRGASRTGGGHLGITPPLRSHPEPTVRGGWAFWRFSGRYRTVTNTITHALHDSGEQRESSVPTCATISAARTFLGVAALQAGAVVRDARGPHRLYESAVRRLFATTGGCVTVAAFGAEFVRVGEGLESRKFPLPRSRCHEAIMRAL